MKIFAISGGGDGNFGTPYEIKKFDEEIVKMTGKKNPKLLFISFSQTSLQKAENYYNVINSNFSGLGCNCEHLSVIDLKQIELVKQKINNANIIYVGGGNTLRLMKVLRKYKIDNLLHIAWQSGTVLCGLSAGAICWCNFGNSYFRKIANNVTQYIKVGGLGFVPLLFCPRYDIEIARQEDLKRMMKTTKGVAVAFDDCTALQVINNNYKVFKAKENAKAYRCYWLNNKYIREELPECGNIENLTKVHL